MDALSVVGISGVFITNVSIILAAWIKMKTDIAAINVSIQAISIRVTDMEEDHSRDNDKLHIKVDKMSDSNNLQHDAISLKIDGLKDSLHHFQVTLAKQLK